jgi:hypothetical protein
MSGVCGVSARPPSSIRRRNASSNTRCKLIVACDTCRSTPGVGSKRPRRRVHDDRDLARVERKTSRKLGTAARGQIKGESVIFRDKEAFSHSSSRSAAE